MNSPFDKNRKHSNYQEAVISDNKFHSRLSDVRNQKQQTNHPDIELLKEEQRKQRQKHLATMYGMPALQATPQDFGTPQDFDQTIHPGQLQQNRSALLPFEEIIRTLEKETKRASKFQRPLTIAIVGFHQMQAVIEQYGNLAYDAALQRISDVLTQVIDIDIDSIGRYSGDRFIMILPETPGPNATMTAETIRGYFDMSPIAYNQFRFIVQASVGMACHPIHGNDWKLLLAKADLACDELYKRGGNSFGFAPMR